MVGKSLCLDDGFGIDSFGFSCGTDGFTGLENLGLVEP